MQAQTHDWLRVETLAPGTSIVVTNDLRFPMTIVASRRSTCVLDVVTQDGLSCRYFAGVYWVPRASILQVHLTDGGKAVGLGLAIGAGAGAGLAAIPHESASGTAGDRAFLGALAGLFFGFFFVKAFLHPVGQLLFEQP